MQPKSLIVMAVDGLRASALGSYGNTWYGTPALDRVASDSILLDNFLLESHDVAGFYRAVSLGEWADACSEAGRDTILVTDDPAVREMGCSQSFDRVALVPDPEIIRIAEDAIDVSSSAVLALLLDQIEQTGDDRSVFAWTHLRFAAGPWDAPLGLIEPLLTEDDPEVEASPAPPNSNDPSEDESFQATARYAAQVMALDHCLAALLPTLDGQLGADGYTLAIVGVRGFALGEHGRIGIEDPRPYSELRHAPLIVRQAHCREHRRSPRLTTTRELPGVLTSDNPWSECQSDNEEVLFGGPGGVAYENQDWRLITDREGQPQLYSKPDDRWETNDVASIHPNEVEELEERLRSRAKRS